LLIEVLEHAPGISRNTIAQEPRDAANFSDHTPQAAPFRSIGDQREHLALHQLRTALGRIGLVGDDRVSV